jgi:NIPSNAP
VTFNASKLRAHSSGGWTRCGVVLLSFCAGMLIAGSLVRGKAVSAQSDRVFELRIYHCVPGKLPAMEERFRDNTSHILAKHNLNVVGYWTSDSDAPEWTNTFVFLLAHSSRDEANKNWDAMAADPDFQQILQSEQKEKLLERADVLYLHPTDFSPMK